MSKDEIYKKAWDKNGAQIQLTVAMEECAELIKELSKMIRGNDNCFNLIEEIADVEIMLEQLKLHFGMDKIFKKIKIAKIKRLRKRLNGGNH